VFAQVKYNRKLDRFLRRGRSAVRSEWRAATHNLLKLHNHHMATPSLSTSGETLTIEESMNLEGENGERRNVGDEYEWSWSCG